MARHEVGLNDDAGKVDSRMHGVQLPDGATIRALLRELVRSASEIVLLVEQGAMDEAMAMLEERNRRFEAVREAVDGLRQSPEPTQPDDETMSLLADAGAAHFHLTLALDAAREGLRREMASTARGSSAGSTYGRAAGPAPQRKLDERR